MEIGKLFEFPSTNSKITKEYCKSNSGDIPVYASSKNEASTIGKIKDNIKGVKYYFNCLSWNRNGSVGYVFIRDHRFATNEDHRAMVISSKYEDKLDKLYLKYEIEKQLLLNGFSFLNKCGVDKIKKVEIKIPVDSDNNFDLSSQKDIARKHEDLKKLRSNMAAIYEDISNVKVKLDDNYKTKKVPMSDLFEIKKGSAEYTKAYIRVHPGEFPLYSSRTTHDGEIGSIDSSDYDAECLTWTTDGIYAGTVFYRNGKFSMTTHCGVLLLKDKFKDNIDLRYVQYQLDLYLRDYATGEGNKRVTASMMSDVPVNIIIDQNDEFDLEQQQGASQKHFKIKEIKKHIKETYEDIELSQIEL